jgi:hypothetical protein
MKVAIDEKKNTEEIPSKVIYFSWHIFIFLNLSYANYCP